MAYTKKQLALLNLWREEKLKRINILTGSVRSGKTWISLVLWAFFVAALPSDYCFLMCGKTLNTLKRNCLDLLSELIGETHFKYSISKKEALLFGRKIYLEGANDQYAEQKIRGLTLGGAYCDELSLFSENYFKMLLTRLSLDGAKLIATTNPDRPNHWLMGNYIRKQAEKELFVMEFSVEDNDFLPAEYLKSLKKEYAGVFYERFILGKWVNSEGVIYRKFIENKKDFIVKELPGRKDGKGHFITADGLEIETEFSQIGIDFGGNKSSHAFVLTGFGKGFKNIVISDEMYFQGNTDPGGLNHAFGKFLTAHKGLHVTEAFADNAEPVLINGLRSYCSKNNFKIMISNAKKGSILDRIRAYTILFENKGIYISEKCTNLIRALETAVWDHKSPTDKRLDNFSSNIDSLDAMEYATENMMDNILRIVCTNSRI